MPEDLQIDDVTERDEYEARAGGEVVGVLGYQRKRDELVILHTSTGEAFRGHGYAGRLVDRAVADAERDGLRVVAVCPFARSHLAGERGAG